jgi:hypothetical protein
MPYVSGKGLLRHWTNTRPGLVGKGAPLAMGAFPTTPRPNTAQRGAYAILSQIGGDNNWVAEGNIFRARVSARIEAMTDLGAETGAIAYANALLQIPAERPVIMGWRLVALGDVAGPIYTGTGSDLESYLVDADIYIGNTA